MNDDRTPMENSLREALDEFDHHLTQWARAYPEGVFPEPDMGVVRTALEARGITIDCVSASNMRHVVKQLDKLFQPVRAALSAAPAQEPVAEAIRELIGEIEQEFVALPDLPAWIRRLQERVRIAPPDWKGYALLGTGQYAINHTPAPMDPQLGAELIISIATEVDKAGNRQVGEERDTDPNAGPIMPEQMAVRIGFLTPAALDALESQLRHLRRENFPESASPLPQEVSQAEAYLQEMREHGNADDATEAAAHLARVKVMTQQKCTTCGDSGVVDDGEIDCYSNGAPFENGPIKCVKDCPACGGVRGAQEGKAGEGLAKELRDAATSLETISTLAGRKTYGDPPIETYMDTFMDVRSYAAARARVAREALSATLSASSKGEQR